MQDVCDMDLLDWFAGQALAAIIVRQATRERISTLALESGRTPNQAREAYDLAQSMLKERAKRMAVPVN